MIIKKNYNQEALSYLLQPVSGCVGRKHVRGRLPSARACVPIYDTASPLPHSITV